MKYFSRGNIYITVLTIIGISLCGLVKHLPVFGQESGVTVQATPKPIFIPNDEVLNLYLKTPVHELLKDFAVRIDDDNYQAEVFGSVKPVMVLFSACPNNLSNGLGALVKTLHENYPDIKVCHYDLGKDILVSRKEVLTAANLLRKKYPVRDLPYLIFYRLENGIIKEMPGDYNFFGGIANLYKLKYWIREYGDMPKALFRSFLSQDQSPETKKLPSAGELLVQNIKAGLTAWSHSPQPDLWGRRQHQISPDHPRPVI